ncbi:hypothetical protein WMZ97_13020 [Lentibacillus sp. N15]|uniref:hypothetical protein n=1 Tax=Lentibacillus songyuanensis TaxID=3136161 RepID=UPI0031BAE338
METERFKVWYRANGKPISVYVDATSFVEASLTAKRRLNAEIIKIIHCDSGLEDSQLDRYMEIQAKCYEARWFGDEEKRSQSLKERVDFEYLNMPKLEFTNIIQEQIYIPPYRDELLPDNLKEVVERHS